MLNRLYARHMREYRLDRAVLTGLINRPRWPDNRAYEGVTKISQQRDITAFTGNSHSCPWYMCLSRGTLRIRTTLQRGRYS